MRKMRRQSLGFVGPIPEASIWRLIQVPREKGSAEEGEEEGQARIPEKSRMYEKKVCACVEIYGSENAVFLLVSLQLGGGSQLRGNRDPVTNSAFARPFCVAEVGAVKNYPGSGFRGDFVPDDFADQRDELVTKAFQHWRSLRWVGFLS